MKFRISYVLIPILVIWCVAIWMWFGQQMKRESDARQGIWPSHMLRAHLPNGTRFGSVLIAGSTGQEREVFQPSSREVTQVNAELSAMIPDMAQMHFALHQAVESKMRSDWKRIGRLELKVSGESHEFLPIFLTTRDRLGLEWHGKHFEAGINESVLARIRNAMQ